MCWKWERYSSAQWLAKPGSTSHGCRKLTEVWKRIGPTPAREIPPAPLRGGFSWGSSCWETPLYLRLPLGAHWIITDDFRRARPLLRLHPLLGVILTSRSPVWFLSPEVKAKDQRSCWKVHLTQVAQKSTASTKKKKTSNNGSKIKDKMYVQQIYNHDCNQSNCFTSHFLPVFRYEEDIC